MKRTTQSIRTLPPAPSRHISVHHAGKPVIAMRAVTLDPFKLVRHSRIRTLHDEKKNYD